MVLSERGEYFERLYAMRASYRARTDDGGGQLSIEDAVLYAEAVMIADADAASTPATDLGPVAEAAAPIAEAAASVAMIQFDWTDASRQVRRVDLPALGPRADGHWTSADDGWRHLGVLLDRFGPTGSRQD
jgi:hypothetical protein